MLKSYSRADLSSSTSNVCDVAITLSPSKTCISYPVPDGAHQTHSAGIVIEPSAVLACLSRM